MNRPTSMMRRRTRLLAGLAAALLLATPALGHQPVDAQLRDVDARIAAHPDDAELRLRRAELHRARGSWEEARADYERARRLDPRLAAVDFGLGRMLLEAGHPTEALAAADRFLARQPEHAGGRELRGRALAELGRHAEAARELDRSIRRSVDAGDRPAPETYAARARALVRAGRPGGALAGVEEGILRLGRPISLEVEALDLEVALGHFDAAIARIDRLRDGSALPAHWLLRRGEILGQAGRSADARRALDDALASLSDVPAARRSLPGVMALERAIREARSQAGSR